MSVSINKWPRPLPRRTRLLWARLVLLAWRGFFRARTVATARVQTYTRMSGVGRSILPLVDNFRFGSYRRSCMPAAIGKGQQERYLVLTTARSRGGIPSGVVMRFLRYPLSKFTRSDYGPSVSLQMRTNPDGLTRSSPAPVPDRVQTDGSLAISCPVGARCRSLRLHSTAWLAGYPRFPSGRSRNAVPGSASSPLFALPTLRVSRDENNAVFRVHSFLRTFPQTRTR